MAVHMIVLTKPNDAVVSRIQEVYPDNYQITQTCYLVQSKNITQKIATTVGIKGEDRIDNASGAVFKLNGAYSGFASRSLWEWLDQAEEQE